MKPDEIVGLPEKKLTGTDLDYKNLHDSLLAEQKSDTTAFERIPAKVSIDKEHQKFVMPDETTPSVIDAVILFSIKKRDYYDQVQDDGPLFCKSLGAVFGQPTREGIELVSFLAPGQVPCKDCAANVWGTGKNGKGKACKEKRRTWLVYPKYEGILRLDIPTSSIVAFDDYCTRCDGAGIPLAGVVTKMLLEKQSEGKKIWSTFRFERGDRIDHTSLVSAVSFREHIKSNIQVFGAVEDEALGGAGPSSAVKGRNVAQDNGPEPPPIGDDDIPF